MANAFIGIASFIHVYIFAMESLLWGRPKTNRVFGIDSETAAQNRLFAFNQGFYNLFLAIAAAGGIGLGFNGFETVATTLKIYACSSMIAAALVLLYSQPKLLRPVLIQGLPPLLGLVALFTVG